MHFVYISHQVLLTLLMFAVPCSIYNIASNYISSTEEQISWKCIDSGQTSEFTVIYTLDNKDQCNAADEAVGQQQSMDCMTCNRMLLDIVSSEHYYYVDLSGLHPFSTYNYSVQARTPGFDGSVVNGGQFITENGEGECHP